VDSASRVTVLEEREEEFSNLDAVRAHLGWISRQTHSRSVIASRKRYPRLEVWMTSSGHLVVSVVESEKVHASMAFLSSPAKACFERYQRHRAGRVKEVAAVTIVNGQGCWIMLDDESPYSFYSGCGGNTETKVNKT
jgi:hypothetical protein